MHREALAFVARREGRTQMEAARWRHVMSLELGWMRPAQAARYVEACQKAGLLVPEGDALRLTFDAHSVEIPRGFRPDPDAVPDQGPASGPDGFSAWLPKVAHARNEDVGATMAAVEALQEQTGGLLHAEAALLVLGQRGGLDVRDAARAALTRA